MITFQQYLDENGLHNLTKEERKNAHKAFRIVYQREYRKLHHRRKKKKVEIYFDPEAYLGLEEKAREHDLSVPGFIRSTIRSYNEQTYILRDRQTAAAIEAAFRQCASCLTQCAFEARRSNSVPLPELEKLQGEIKALREKVSRALAFPPTAQAFLLGQQQVNPDFLVRLKRVLNNLLTDNNDT